MIKIYERVKKTKIYDKNIRKDKKDENNEENNEEERNMKG